MTILEDQLAYEEQQLRIQYGKSLLSKRETAKQLGISTETLDRLRQDGQIKSKKVRGQIKFSLQEVARYIVEA